MRWSSFAVVLAGVAELVACGGGSGGAVAHEAPVLSVWEIPPPTGMWGSMGLSWTAPAGATGFVVQRRQLPGAFQVEATLPAQWGYEYGLDPSVPERTDHEFRVVAKFADGAQVASAAVPYHRGLALPELLCSGTSWACEGSPFGLAWINRSRIATELRLERRIFPLEGVAGPWERVPVPADATQVVDEVPAYVDGAFLTYRLSVGLDGEWSEASVRSTAVAAPYAPRDGSATSIEGGVRIQLVNQSAFADEVRVYRRRYGEADWTFAVKKVPATGPGQVVIFDDVVAPGAYQYRLFTSVDFNTPFPIISDSIELLALSGLPAASGWSTRLDALPPSHGAARRPGGDYALAANLIDPLVFADGLVLGPDVLPLPAGRAIGNPGVVLDPQGSPHALYGGRIPSAASPDMPLVHAWHDGAGWRTEEVLRRPDVSVTTFGAGADGVLRAAFADYWARSLELVTAGAGGWTTEDLGVHLPASTAWSPPLVTADAAGNPSLIVCQDPNSCLPRYLWRDDAGWHAELVPLDDGGAALGFIRPLALTPGPVPRLALSYAKLAPGSPTRLVTLERGPSGWGPIQPLGDAVDASVGAVSADGSSLIVATGSNQGGPAKAWVVDASGTRTVDWFRPSGEPFTAGIGPDGKGWILAWVTRYAAGDPPPPVVVFEER